MDIHAVSKKGGAALNRFKALNLYQKVILLISAAMVIVFSILYPVTISREGYEYRDVLLIPRREGASTVYSGKVHGENAAFTVYDDGSSVEFCYGDTLYGPYTVRQDPTAAPDSVLSGNLTGIELLCGDEVVFRGGVIGHGSSLSLFNEDGSPVSSYVMKSSNGTTTTVMDQYGNLIDENAPSFNTILELMSGPDLTHNGSVLIWFLCVLLCVLNIVSILFADELFRFHMSFSIRNANRAEPSEWEIASRYISWTLLAIVSLSVFIAGLH